MAFLELNSGNLSFKEYYDLFDSIKTWIKDTLPFIEDIDDESYAFPISNKVYCNLRNTYLDDDHFPMPNNIKIKSGDVVTLYQDLRYDSDNSGITIIYYNRSDKSTWLGVIEGDDLHKHIEACLQENRIPFLQHENQSRCSCYYAMLAKQELKNGKRQYEERSAISLLGSYIDRYHLCSETDMSKFVFYRCYEMDNDWRAGCLTNIATLNGDYPTIFRWAEYIIDHRHQLGLELNEIYFLYDIIEEDDGCFSCIDGVFNTSGTPKITTILSKQDMKLTIYPAEEDFQWLVDFYNSLLDYLGRTGIGIYENDGLAYWYSQELQSKFTKGNLLTGTVMEVDNYGTSFCACRNLGDEDADTNTCPPSVVGSLKYKNKQTINRFTINKHSATAEIINHPEGNPDYIFTDHCCPVVGASTCTSSTLDEYDDLTYPSFAGSMNAGFGTKFYNDFSRTLIPKLPDSINGILLKNRGETKTISQMDDNQEKVECKTKGYITLPVTFYVFPRSAFMYVANYWIDRERKGCLNLLLRKIVDAYNQLDDSLKHFKINFKEFAIPAADFVYSHIQNFVAHDGASFYDTIDRTGNKEITFEYTDKAKIYSEGGTTSACPNFLFGQSTLRVQNSKIQCS